MKGEINNMKYHYEIIWNNMKCYKILWILKVQSVQKYLNLFFNFYYFVLFKISFVLVFDMEKLFLFFFYFFVFFHFNFLRYQQNQIQNFKLCNKARVGCMTTRVNAHSHFPRGNPPKTGSKSWDRERNFQLQRFYINIHVQLEAQRHFDSQEFH